MEQSKKSLGFFRENPTAFYSCLGDQPFVIVELSEPIKVDQMTQVVLENLNPVVVEKLQVLAQKHNRSLSEEIEVILEQVTSASQSDSEATRAAFRERLESARLAHGNRVFSDSVDLLREDRQR